MIESERQAFIEALYRIAWMFDHSSDYAGIKLPRKAEHALHEALHMTVMRIAVPPPPKSLVAGSVAIMSTEIAVLLSMMPKQMSRKYEIRTLAAEIRVLRLLDGFEGEKGQTRFLIQTAREQRVRSLRRLVEAQVDGDQAKADAAEGIQNILAWGA